MKTRSSLGAILTVGTFLVSTWLERRRPLRHQVEPKLRRETKQVERRSWGDASTAIRFHFGELLAGVPWQAAQMVLIGLTP